MFRKLLLLLILAAIIVVFWNGASWFRHSSDLRATVVLDAPSHLRRGDAVVQGDETIGDVATVSPLGAQQAVSIRIEHKRRNALRSDSLIRLGRRDERPVLIIDSNFAVGRPVEDGAVVHGRDSSVAQVLERTGRRLVPVAKNLEENAASLIRRHRDDGEDIDRDIDEWKAKLPAWKKEGADSLSRHLDEAEKRVGEAEAALRREGRELDARKLHHRFSSWVDSLREKLREEP